MFKREVYIVTEFYDGKVESERVKRKQVEITISSSDNYILHMVVGIKSFNCSAQFMCLNLRYVRAS